MCLTYIVAEVTHCKQADIDFRGHEEIYSEPGGVMDYEEDRSRPKRYFGATLVVIGNLLILLDVHFFLYLNFWWMAKSVLW